MSASDVDALVWLPYSSHAAEAARIHANRAQSLLKHAAAARVAAGLPDSAAQAAAAGGCAALGCSRSRSAQELAAGAEDDCTASLQLGPLELGHKVSAGVLKPGLTHSYASCASCHATQMCA